MTTAPVPVALVKKTGRRGNPNIPPGPGRPKGVPNKLTTEIRQMVTAALDKAGGVDYLVQRAKDPKTAGAFLTLVGKVLPLQVTGADGGSLQVTQVVRVIMDDKQ